MNTLEFCTYFDHRYLPRGLALYRSLVRHAGPFRLWVLCLSPECFDLLNKLALPGIKAVALAELENADPELKACRANRSLIEYYFTCSPCLPWFLFRQEPAIDTLIYVDADLYFFGDPRTALAATTPASVGITPHRFAANIRRKYERYGEHNVGWLSFRRDPDGLACLGWWRERCLEWCYDRVEGERYADQKYLDRFGTLFGGVRSLGHKGANLAPWNLANDPIEYRDGQVWVGGDPLIFFHFQGVSRLRGGYYDTNLVSYRARMTETVRDRIFLPYLRELSATEELVAAVTEGRLDLAHVRTGGSLAGRLRKQLDSQFRFVWARLSGRCIRV